MRIGDQFFARRSDRQRFSAAGIPAILVRLDNSRGNDKIGFNDASVHRNRHTSGCFSKIDQSRRILRFIVNHPVARNDVGAKLCDLLLMRRSAMHANAAQKGDVFVTHTGRFQLRKNWRDQQIDPGTNA